MTLTFPTLAEQALREAQTSGQPLAKVARRLGAEVEHSWPGTVTYTFEDDTALIAKGRGRNYTVTTELP